MNYYVKQDIPELGLEKGYELIREKDTFLCTVQSSAVTEEAVIESNYTVELDVDYVKNNTELFEPE
jgi:hypothetical protein